MGTSTPPPFFKIILNKGFSASWKHFGKEHKVKYFTVNNKSIWNMRKYTIVQLGNQTSFFDKAYLPGSKGGDNGQLIQFKSFLLKSMKSRFEENCKDS